MYTNFKRLVNKLVRDKNNKIVWWQFPNPPLMGWFIFLVLAQVVAPGSIRTGLTQLSTGFLFVWSYLEITQGTTYFRRLLGGAILLAVLVGYFH